MGDGVRKKVHDDDPQESECFLYTPIQIGAMIPAWGLKRPILRFLFSVSSDHDATNETTLRIDLSDRLHPLLLHLTRLCFRRHFGWKGKGFWEDGALREKDIEGF